jgi:L-fuculose-phosphate aldolase
MAGHVSARRADEETYVIKPVTVGFDEVEPDDLVVASLAGRKFEGRHDLPGEAIIHSAVYVARQDVRCVIHTHPPFSTALACTDGVLHPLSWTVGAVGREVPVHDPGVLLIRTPKEGAELAAALGGHGALILKHHGVVVVGPTVAEATIRAVMLENAVKLQWISQGLGTAVVLPEGADEPVARVYDAARFERMFEYALRRQPRSQRPAV